MKLNREVICPSTSISIQPTGFPHVHKSSLRSRIGWTLASSGVAGALLVGSLFGFSHYQATSAASAETGSTMVVRSHAVSDSSSQSASNAYYRKVARQAAIKAGINPQYFIKQIQQESGFNPWVTSPAGAEGIAQFMPATAASLGIDPWNPTQALYGAAKLMADLKTQFYGSYAKALAAYNAGPGAVENAVRCGGGDWYDYLPAETQHYIAVILDW
jgi:soluble lytic murein transglycosylase-like protein